MSEHVGEKTENATPRRLEEATKKGQVARSAEVQSVFVIMAGLIALKFTGPDIWRQLSHAQFTILGHLHDIPVTAETLPGYAITSALVVAACVVPILGTTAVAGLLAGGIQNRFQTASEALTPNWGRLNPGSGLKRIFSPRALGPASLSILKLGVILTLCQGEIRKVLHDPVFYTTTSLAGIADFLAKASFTLTLHVAMALVVIAALDYAFQCWRTTRDLMMTREEVKEEMKSSEGNPQVRARQRRRRSAKAQRQMLLDVPKADVVVTNPTHLAIALRYDRATMKAPVIVAKGSRLNALKIREIATAHHVPILENKPLARLMFKYGKVGGEIPAQLYAAVAEVLAWVYRVNRYRYYAEQNRAS